MWIVCQQGTTGVGWRAQAQVADKSQKLEVRCHINQVSSGIYRLSLLSAVDVHINYIHISLSSAMSV